MTESGQGGSPQAGGPWGPPVPAQPDAQPEPLHGHPAQGQPPQGQPAPGQPALGQPSYGQPAPGQPSYGQPAPGQPSYGQPAPGQPAPGQPSYGQPAPVQPAYGYPAPGQPAPGQPAPGQPAPGQPAPGGPAAAGPGYGYPPQGHVVGPGYEGPGDPHGYGYPPLPEAVTQYIPPVPAAPSHEEAATQFMAPVPPAPAPAQGEAATQYIAPVPAAPSHEEAATQFIAPVPPAHAQAHDEAATQYIPPVPATPADPAAGFDGLFRGDTQHLPPVQEPVLRQQPPPRPYPPQQNHQQQPHRQPQPPQQGYPQQQFQQQPPPQPHQQYQAPLPHHEPAPAPRRVSPGIIAAVVIGLAVAGLGVGALLSDDKAQNNDPGASTATPTGKGSAAAGGEAPIDPAQPQAVQLDKLLADSNDSRASVIKAVDDIKGCRNLDQAANDLRDAARQREELVTRLQELKVDQLPDNAKLTAALTQAWKSSAQADNSYAAWADDLKGDGDKCKDGKAKSTGNASDGNKASGDATKAKESASGMWNAIAGKYSLTKRDKSQL
ncbi:hypothetical protein [Streptomyces sp. NBC_00454]|uniref:hypothetical protein n=1 Tax=Streptomyces sp. NBC_00454 TaxID=2975747 RepID=UPI0032430B9C